MTKEERKAQRELLKQNAIEAGKPRVYALMKEIEKKIDPIMGDNYFWAPKLVDERYEGFTLYIRGGAAFTVYNDARILRCDPYSESYNRYFENSYFVRMRKNGDKMEEVFGQEIRDKFLVIQKDEKTEKVTRNSNWTKNAEILRSQITEQDWKDIYAAFGRWVKDEPLQARTSDSHRTNYERMRENKIAHANSEMDNDMIIIDMESETALPTTHKVKGKDVTDKGKADLVGLCIRKKEKCEGENAEAKATVYFIEYKCTEKATIGTTSLPEHYDDMKKYYQMPTVLNKMLQMYENKKRYVESPNTFSEEQNMNIAVEGKILFLFSHVNKEKKTEPWLTSATIARKMLEMMEENSDFSAKDTFYFLIDDFASDRKIEESKLRDFQEIYKIAKDKSFTREEKISKINELIIS